MTKGYIYFSIQTNKKLNKRFLGFKYVDPVIDKSYIYTQEINPNTDLLLCYLEGINTVLRNYIEVVGKNQWIKYDILKLATDKRYKRLSKRVDVNDLINPSTEVEEAMTVALGRYVELVNIIGKVDIIYKPDNNYYNLVETIISKIIGGECG